MRGRCIVLFGMAGSGKTFIGERLSQITGFSFLDGDILFTDNDISHLADVTFTDKMRDEYHYRLIDAIKDKIKSESTQIVATCLVKQRHRDLLFHNFQGRIKFVYVYTDDALAMSRMGTRCHFFRPEKYHALKIKYDKVTQSPPCVHFYNGDAPNINELSRKMQEDK